MRINDTVEIQDWELTEQFIRSSGPGGQNVNKTNSAVELRFEALRSPSLSDAIKFRLQKIAGRQWTKEGAIVIYCDETRSQARNRDIARDRLRAMISAALKSRKKRIATKPTYGSQVRRLKSKKIRADIKAGRKAPDHES